MIVKLFVLSALLAEPGVKCGVVLVQADERGCTHRCFVSLSSSIGCTLVSPGPVSTGFIFKSDVRWTLEASLKLRMLK